MTHYKIQTIRTTYTENGVYKIKYTKQIKEIKS